MSDAADLAGLFFECSQLVDQYRSDHFDELDAGQQSRARDLAHQLDDISGHFGLEDVAETLAQIQPEIRKVKDITRQAQQALQQLQEFAEVTKLVGALIALGTAAATGNPGTIAGAILDLTKLVPAKTQAGSATRTGAVG